MPSSLFWALDGCISRVMAEKDLREIGVKQAVTGDEILREQKNSLLLQMGEVYVIGRDDKIVPAEPGAMNKLKALM